MNVVIFASDSKGVASVINIVRELKNTNFNYFFLYSQETQLQFPTHNLDKFVYDSNIPENNWGGIWSDSLNVSLPFIPDVLLIQRDCWQPEQSIIHEFKSKWNCKVTMVEVNTMLINNIETILEMHSRTKYPQNQIDLYFEHSKFTKTQRNKSGFDTSKSIITGNPKCDDLLKVNKEYCYKKYNIDKNKTQILFYSIITSSRNEMFNCLKNLIDKIDHSKYEIFFKPYPGEPYHDNFKHQFFPFLYDNVKVIYDNLDLYPLINICDVHIGPVGSIIHLPLLLDKKIINIDNILTYLDLDLSLKQYLNESGIGVEDSAKFWMGVHGFKTHDELIKFINLDRIEYFKKDINYFLEIVKKSTLNYDFNLDFLLQEKPNNNKLLKLFDEFNDFNASKRIVKELKKLALQ